MIAVTMTAWELAHYVLEEKDEEWISIALNSAEGPNVAYPDVMNCSFWYRCRKHFVEGTDSYIFFIDYCGGGNPAVCSLEPTDKEFNEEVLLDFFKTWLKDTVEQMGNCADVDDRGERVAYLEIPKPSKEG